MDDTSSSIPKPEATDWVCCRAPELNAVLTVWLYVAIDLTRLELYCFHCKDYVYDDRVEKVFEQPYPRIESVHESDCWTVA